MDCTVIIHIANGDKRITVDYDDLVSLIDRATDDLQYVIDNQEKQVFPDYTPDELKELEAHLQRALEFFDNL